MKNNTKRIGKQDKAKAELGSAFRLKRVLVVVSGIVIIVTPAFFSPFRDIIPKTVFDPVWIFWPAHHSHLQFCIHYTFQSKYAFFADEHQRMSYHPKKKEQKKKNKAIKPCLPFESPSEATAAIAGNSFRHPHTCNTDMSAPWRWLQVPVAAFLFHVRLPLAAR